MHRFSSHGPARLACRAGRSALLVGLFAFASGDASAASLSTQDAPVASKPGAQRNRSEIGQPIVVTPEHAAAVEAGLAWLAEHQKEDGSWRAKIGYKAHVYYEYTADGPGHVGVTALAGMAFLAGGHLPGRGRYGEAASNALEFVLSCVQEDGYVTHSGSRMYSHAFATLFLAEICGMTRSDRVLEKLQLAVDFIVNSQNADGGWRYEPYAVESDMSIVVCQVLALRAARNIGIRVPKEVIDRAARYVVDSAVTPQSARRSFRSYDRNEVGSFHYQKEDGSRSSFPLTAAGVTALFGVGIYSDEAIDAGVRYLRSHLNSFNSRYGARANGHYFFWYGHYYGVQAMYTAGNDGWESYFTELREVLLGMQREDGSFPNQVGPGAAFGTAVGVLILEIPFRFLPIFQR